MQSGSYLLGTARWPGPGLHEDDELSSKFQQQPSFKIIIIIIHYPSYFKGWYELFAIRASCSRQSYTTNKTEQRTVMVIWVRLACALTLYICASSSIRTTTDSSFLVFFSIRYLLLGDPGVFKGGKEELLGNLDGIWDFISSLIQV